MKLTGMRVAIDVQHLYKPWPHQGDRGTAFKVAATGAVMYEADASLQYGAALSQWLAARGATVLTNDVVTKKLVGSYRARNLEATAFGADAYLACHVNAGGGGYPLCEAMGMSLGEGLGQRIVARLTEKFVELAAGRTRSLHMADRGAICVEACYAKVAAVIVEPFFGDNPHHQQLMTSPLELQRLGETIGEGVADWWANR